MAKPLQSVFSYGGHINWYPGHMAKATKSVQQRLKMVDIVVEVRDARVPLSSHNTVLEPMLASKERVVVFNKADLANSNLQRPLLSHCKSLGLEALCTVANTCTAVKKVLAAVQAKANAASSFKVAGSTMLVVGIPNVGKSSLINALREHGLRASGRRRGKGAKQGPTPGLTRNVSALMVSMSPRLYLLDTPGIMMPRVPDLETGMKLAVTGALRDATVPEPVMAEYLLHWFNSMGALRYVAALNLPGPTDSVDELLNHVAATLHAKTPNGDANHDVAARHVVNMFRSGQLGRHTLDTIPTSP